MTALMRGMMALIALGALLNAAPVYGQGTFNGAGGPFVAGLMLDLDELQASFSNVLDIRSDFNFGDEDYFLIFGGGGFGGSHIRLGGMGGHGEWTFPVKVSDAPFDRVIMSLSLQGFLFDSVLAEFDAGGLSVGGLIGFGDMELQLIQDFQGSFHDFVTDPPLKFSMKRTYWFAQPFAAIELRLLEFMGVRLSAGYNVGLSFGEWELSDGQAVPGGPLKNLGFPTLQFMVIFGG